MSNHITGWLFDVYPSSQGMTLWFIDQNGGKHCCTAKFSPSFFLGLRESDHQRALTLARQSAVPLSLRRTLRRELYSNEQWEMTEISVHHPLRFREVVRFYELYFPHFVFFNSDVLPAQMFLYERDLFPLALGEYEIDDDGVLIGWRLQDRREDLDYTLPPLSIMTLRSVGEFDQPKYQRSLQLELSYEEKTFVLEQQTAETVLEALNWHLHHYDPDILLTEYGDATLLRTLTDLAVRHKMPLLLNRDPAASYRVSRESSFWQYGKVVHKDGAFEIAGRWHLDLGNSFTMAESSLDGLFELARLTKLLPQRQGRASIGTGLSSLQFTWAYENKVLIPAKKREPEEFKTGTTLLLADRGGLIFQPPLGYHENVAELDFVSMYPSIMVDFNVSPETINCRCCHNNLVPELGYTICTKRRGIVPETLAMVVRRRAEYKRRKKQLRGTDDPMAQIYDHRQNALKWMLVSCFGYLGYKNARYGRIEAHEAVNAFARGALLAAKTIAETRGFHLLHGIIDCLWLKKEGAEEHEYELLCQEIKANVGIDISLEGIYRWICFPASKLDPLSATGNRYVGMYRHGELKIRGIEARRRDTPRFVKQMQLAMLERLKEAEGVNDVASAVPDLLSTAREYVSKLQHGTVNAKELVLRRHITKDPGEYSNNSVSAVVSQMIEEMGIPLVAGEMIEYILIDQSGKKQPFKAKPLALYAFEDGYDVEKYTEFALKAVETLLLSFGYDMEALKRCFQLPIRVKRGVRKPGKKSTTTGQFLGNDLAGLLR